MLNLIQADLFKMRKSPVIKILFGITTLCAIVMTIMAYLIPQGVIGDKYTGIGFLFSDLNVISILGAVLAGILICGDFENKTIHEAVTSGCNRGAIIVSKAVVFFSALAFILIPYAIITGIALGTGAKFDMGAVSAGFLNILSKDSGIALSASGILKILAAMLTLMLVYMAQLSLCVPLAFVLKKPVLVVVNYYGLSIGSGQLAILSSSSPVLKNILSWTPFGGNYSFLTMNSGPGDLLKAIVVCFICIIIMIVIAFSLFRKSEIK
ncbi:ABC transporter permease [[Clostridium] fimetarium]|uniref:ABC-2 type transport system permease protein n=1 Tax=[Clostridium] fimetarium TaxID=99656 RepID=A0A1I0R6U3_9FIRM|nr:ABC transporter permease [[Clostridium] fimetarium]SEW35772.1 ABC-2 type transport system permease protein [[Clostridium] fimetarium]